MFTDSDHTLRIPKRIFRDSLQIHQRPNTRHPIKSVLSYRCRRIADIHILTYAAHIRTHKNIAKPTTTTTATQDHDQNARAIIERVSRASQRTLTNTQQNTTDVYLIKLRSA